MSDGTRWTPEEGDTVSGPEKDYLLLEHIDTGGFTTVYKAQIENTGEIVGLKYPYYNSPNPDFEAFVEREVRALQTIRCLGGHDNVMTLREHFVERGTHFIIVDFIEGEVLGESSIADNPERIREIGLRICTSLLIFHWNDLIYRDVKADNLILTAGDEPVLIDMNTVRTRPTCPSCGSIVPHNHANEPKCSACGENIGPVTRIGNAGRGHYKAPEQSDASIAPGPWTDVYGIGKLLFLLLTGFVTQADEVDLSEHRDAPRYLTDILHRATARNPTKRFATVEEMGRALWERTDAPGDPKALLEDAFTNQQFEFRSGCSIGRDEGGSAPTIDTKDYRRLVSRKHASIEHNGDRWVLIDSSRNGTFLRRGNRWHGILNSEGKRYQPRNDIDYPGHRAISLGDRLAPVYPKFEKQYRFLGPEWTNI